MSKNTRYVDLLVDIKGRSLDRSFTYIWPWDEVPMRKGLAVEIPWRNSYKVGIVMGERKQLPKGLSQEKVREVVKLLFASPLWGESLQSIAQWLAKVYRTPLSMAYRTVVPGPVMADLRAGLQKKRRIKRAFKPLETQSYPVSDPKKLVPNLFQQKILEEIAKSDLTSRTHLLHGVTGSGKTLIYMELVGEALAQQKSSLVLVPEVALTPQTCSLYQARFGDQVALMHSGLTAAQRRDQWWKIKRGESRVVVGTRSAVFAPVQNLAWIIIDEEHDSSFKDEGIIGYHVRQIAHLRVRNEGAKVILGSATPSLESYFLAKKGEIGYHRLSHRATNAPLPTVHLVGREKKRREELLSKESIDQLELQLVAKKQSILLLNRRGFAPYVECSFCQWSASCPDCSVSLTWHKKRSILLCHCCGHTQSWSEVCPGCGGFLDKIEGAGTEKLEEEVQGLFPEARIGRLDRDKSSELETTLKKFAQGKIDILIGTQMVAKGLDVERVTLAIVVAADTGLHLPDFRAGERLFSLLTQVAGRPGRGRFAGRVLVEAQNVDHRVFQRVLEHDSVGFLEEELELREALNFPPYQRLLRVEIRHANERQAQRESEKLGEVLDEVGEEYTVLGPSPAPLSRLRGEFRWHLLILCDSWTRLVHLGHRIQAWASSYSVELYVDYDPIDLL